MKCIFCDETLSKQIYFDTYACESSKCENSLKIKISRFVYTNDIEYKFITEYENKIYEVVSVCSSTYKLIYMYEITLEPQMSYSSPINYNISIPLNLGTEYIVKRLLALKSFI